MIREYDRRIWRCELDASMVQELWVQGLEALVGAYGFGIIMRETRVQSSESGRQRLPWEPTTLKEYTLNRTMLDTKILHVPWE